MISTVMFGIGGRLIREAGPETRHLPGLPPSPWLSAPERGPTRAVRGQPAAAGRASRPLQPGGRPLPSAKGRLDARCPALREDFRHRCSERVSMRPQVFGYDRSLRLTAEIPDE